MKLVKSNRIANDSQKTAMYVVFLYKFSDCDNDIFTVLFPTVLIWGAFLESPRNFSGP